MCSNLLLLTSLWIFAHYSTGGTSSINFGDHNVQNLPSRPAKVFENDTDQYTRFDLSVSRNTTVQVGETAYLTCRVKNLGDRAVSWLRVKDYHIIAVGTFTYTVDERFSSIHRPETEDWILEIKYPTTNDSGKYECQVSTEPKTNFEVTLNVIVARANILRSPKIYVKTGSSLDLQCIVTPPSAQQDYVFWYHDDKVITYDDLQDRVQVDTSSDFKTVSKLSISNIDDKDSGNYTCRPSRAKSASVRLYVLDAETSAARQHGESKATIIFESKKLTWMIVVLFLLTYWKQFIDSER